MLNTVFPLPFWWLTDVIKIKDRPLWVKITTDSSHPLHELLPRKRGHPYILPRVRTARHERCSIHRFYSIVIHTFVLTEAAELHGHLPLVVNLTSQFTSVHFYKFFRQPQPCFLVFCFSTSGFSLVDLWMSWQSSTALFECLGNQALQRVFMTYEWLSIQTNIFSASGK